MTKLTKAYISYISNLCAGQNQVSKSNFLFLKFYRKATKIPSKYMHKSSIQY